MKNEKKTHWLRTTILVLVACGIVGLILSAVLFFRDPGPTYASATLVLTFDGAAAGIAPNGVPFDLWQKDYYSHSGFLGTDLLEPTLMRILLACYQHL